MKKLEKLIIAFMLAGPAVACTTEDPRGELRQPFFRSEEPAGFGEQCGPGINTCQGGLTCYEGSCVSDDIAAACTPNPCGDGFCIARGEPITTFCNCPEGQIYDGITCVADGSPEFRGSVLDTGLTCPEEELAPGVVDETTQDCPAGSECTDESGGDCLETYVELNGDIDDTMFGGSVTGGAAETDAECVRKYFDDGTGGGLTLNITGGLANTLLPGATSISLDINEGNPVSGGSFLVWPQGTGFADPAGDAAYVDVTIDGGALDATDVGGIGGLFTVSAVTGEEDDDGIIASGEGRIGGEFFVGVGGGDFISGAFTVSCGNNVDLGAP